MPASYDRLVKKLAKSPSVANPWALAHKIQHQQEDKRTMNLFDQLVAKKKTRKARARAAVDTHAKRELELFLDNDGQMYSRKTAFLNAAAKKMRAGTYDHALAGKLWLAWVNEGAKKYCSENYCPGATFSPATREAVANDVARHEHDALVRGERGAISVTPTAKVANAKKPKAPKAAKRLTGRDTISAASTIALSTWIPASKLATVRSQLRHRGLDPASARSDDGARGAYVSNVISRAKMRGENMSQVVLAIRAALLGGAK